MTSNSSINSEFTTENFLVSASNAVGQYFIEISKLMHEHGKDYFYYAVEGFDDYHYYNNRISSTLGTEAYHINCKNKKNVILLYNKIKTESSLTGYRIVFFVDADYDVNIFPEDIYVTKTYSIENLYCSISAYKRILRQHFFIDENSNVFKKLINFWITEHSAFFNAVVELCAWEYHIRQQKYCDKNLDFDKLFNEFIHLEIENTQKKYSLESLEEKFPDAPKISKDNIFKIQEQFRGDLYGRIRGKYVIAFLIEYIKFLKDAFNKDRGKFHKHKVKACNLSVDRKNFSYVLSSIADNPPCLREYILSR